MYEPMPVTIEQRTRRKNASRPLGRRALLWAVGLFILSQGVLTLILANDGFLVRDLVRHGRLKFLRDRMAEASSPPKVVILLGSSHVQVGLRARQISLEMSEVLGRPVVVNNQGLPGGSAFRSLLATDRLLREGIVPDLVVLETFPMLFTGPPEYDDATEVALPSSRLDEGDVEFLHRHAIGRSDLGADRHIRKLAPGHHFRVGLNNFFIPWALPFDRRVARPLEENTPGRWSPEQLPKVMVTVQRDCSPMLQKFSPDHPRPIGAVGEVVASLRARGTKVVFLATPEGPLFRSWYPAGRYANSVVWLRDLAALHGVPMIDAREWTDREEMFIDSHHLSPEGAEQFSRWLGREVLVPQLEAGR